MSQTRVRVRFLASLAGLGAVAALGLAACADEAPESPAPLEEDGSGGGAAGGFGPGDAGAGGDAGAPASTGASSTPPTCDGPLGPPQAPSALPACCDDVGDSHCLAEVPDELAGFVAGCDGGGYCVPDVFISTGGVFTPPACTSIAGEGVCMSKCIPAVKENANLLTQDVCGGSELCVPCVSPLDGMPTGACELAFTCDETPPDDGPDGPEHPDDPSTCVHEGDPVLDPSFFPACPNGCGGKCVPLAAVPADQAGQLADCDAENKCVPDLFVETGGDFILASCRSVNDAEGRCVSLCIPQAAEQAASLPQATCAAGEVCAPCYDPFDGTDTGVCRASCDPGPTEPPKTFERCCGGIGSCVPASLVPAEQQSRFDGEGCTASPDGTPLLCVPDIFKSGSFTPTPCETSFWLQVFGASSQGACIPKCLPDVRDVPFLEDDNCVGLGLPGMDCVPCENGGSSTGACDAVQ